MEFLEFLLLFVAVILIIYKPEKEMTAWWLTFGSWFVMAFIENREEIRVIKTREESRLEMW